jgi:hypothetical protein
MPAAVPDATGPGRCGGQGGALQRRGRSLRSRRLPRVAVQAASAGTGPGPALGLGEFMTTTNEEARDHVCADHDCETWGQDPDDFDPNETLSLIRGLVADIQEGDKGPGPVDFTQFAEDLAGLVEDLDGWLDKGGCLPDAWTHDPGDEECNTCGGTGRWESTLEDAPTTLVDLGPCPECTPAGMSA